MSSPYYSSSSPWHIVFCAATDGHDRCTHLPRRRTGKGIKVKHTYTFNIRSLLVVQMPSSVTCLDRGPSWHPFLLLLAVQLQGRA